MAVLGRTVSESHTLLAALAHASLPCTELHVVPSIAEADEEHVLGAGMRSWASVAAELGAALQCRVVFAHVALVHAPLGPMYVVPALGDGRQVCDGAVLRALCDAVAGPGPLDCHALGPAAVAAAHAVCSVPRMDVPAKASRVSLVLVDRMLDMVAPASHADAAFGDRLFGVLPALGGLCDVQVSMASMCQSGAAHAPHGCLAHPQDPPATELLRVLLETRPKV